MILINFALKAVVNRFVNPPYLWDVVNGPVPLRFSTLRFASGVSRCYRNFMNGEWKKFCHREDAAQQRRGDL
jgi:hypothetical protein